jgi:pimeloyl-ACP methyl ester carboxylesterase
MSRRALCCERTHAPRHSAAFLGAVLVIFAAFCGAMGVRSKPALAATIPRFESTACWQSIPASASARCGFLVVPENRAKANGKTIRVAVAIVRAAGKRLDSTPLVDLDGGPGGAPILSAGLLIASGLNAHRDLIIVDQRGTYLSHPQLTCPTLDRFFLHLLGLVYDAASTRAEHVAATSACRAQFVGNGVDLAAYNTTENAADFADLRRALGYKQWNIYSVSYGTDLALKLIRADPKGVRSVVLDSTVPPNLVTFPGFWVQAGSGFGQLFAACNGQTACRARYGNLRERFAHLVDALESRPVTTTVPDPATKRSVTVTIDGGALVNWLVGMSFQTPRFKDVPGLIDQLAAGKPQAIAASRLAQVTPAGFIGYGLTFGVLCREWYPFSTYAQIEKQGRRVFPSFPASVLAEAPQFTFITEDCKAWNVPAAPPVTREPVRSGVPTLILSGSFDGVTALPWAKAAAASLANSRVILFPGVGHSVLYESACAQAVANSFFAKPGAPDTKCAATLEPPVFTTR